MEQFSIIPSIIWLAVVSPGADFAMVSRTSFITGQRAGTMAALGIALACWFHIAYAIFGLGIVERLFPHMLDLLKIAGAAYLVYLGVTMALARPVLVAENPAATVQGDVGSLATGVLTNALNPKTSVFVVSLYAQVIGHDTPLGVQLGYGVAISISHLLWFVAVAMFLSRPSIRVRVLAHQRAVNGGIGIVLILLGLLLGFSDLAHGGRA